MLKFIKKNRQQFDRDTIGSDKRKYFSPISYSHYEVTLQLIIKYVRGNFIDIGCQLNWNRCTPSKAH